MLEFPSAAAGAGLVPARLGGGPRSGWFGDRWRVHGGGGLRIGEDGLDCAERLAGERLGLVAPGEVLVAAGLDKSLAKSGGAQPIADRVAVDADEASRKSRGGAGGQQSENSLLRRGEGIDGRHRLGLLNFR